jgi:hypothetical protein
MSLLQLSCVRCSCELYSIRVRHAMSIYVLCSCEPCAVCEIYVFCFARSLQGYNWAHEESWAMFEEWCTENSGSVDELKGVNKKLDTLGWQKSCQSGFHQPVALRPHSIKMRGVSARASVSRGVSARCSGSSRFHQPVAPGITIKMHGVRATALIISPADFQRCVPCHRRWSWRR